MRLLESAESAIIRGGLYTENQLVSETPDDYGYGGGSINVGGGYELTEYAMTSLIDEAQNGTDQSVEALAMDMYSTGQSNPFNPGGPYYVTPGGSPPPSFKDIRDSIPGAPKEKVRKVSGKFKIC